MIDRRHQGIVTLWMVLLFIFIGFSRVAGESLSDYYFLKIISTVYQKQALSESPPSATGLSSSNENTPLDLSVSPEEPLKAQQTGNWLSVAPQSMGFNPKDLQTAIINIGEMKGIYSVLVVRNGYLVAEQYFREGTRTKPHNLKSATKSILSALVGIAVEAGSIKLDQPISDYLPYVKHLSDPRKARITVRHLLMMQSGLSPTSYEAYNSWVLNGDWVRAALNRPLSYDPGTHYQYSTGDTHILSAVVTAATGMSTYDFAEQKLFSPMNITIQAWDTDPNGTYQGGNNLSLIPRDMARIGQLYLEKGKYQNRQIIPEWWIDTSTHAIQENLNEVYGAYGYLWYVHPGDGDAFVAVGYGGQYIYVSPRHDAVIVITSTLESKGRKWERQLFGLIREGILGSLAVEPGTRVLIARGREHQNPKNHPDADSQVSEPQHNIPDITSSPDSDDTGSIREVALQSLGRTTSRLNLRAGPGQREPVITTLDAGAKLEVKERTGPWFKVLAGSTTGWVYGDYIDILKPEKTVPASSPMVAVQTVASPEKMQQVIPRSVDAGITTEHTIDPRLSVLERLVTQLRRHLDDSEITQQQLDAELKNTQHQLSDQHHMLLDFDSARGEMISRITDLRGQMDHLAHTLKDIQSDEASVKAEKGVFNQKIREQKDELTRSAMERGCLKADIASIQQVISGLQATLSRAQQARERLDDELLAIRESVEKQQEAEKLSEAYRMTLVSSMNSARRQVEEIDGGLENETTDIRAHIETISKKQKQTIETATEIQNRFQAKWEADQTRLQDIEKTLGDLQQQYQTISPLVSQLETKLDGQFTTHRVVEDRQANLSSDLTALSEQVTGLDEYIKEISQEQEEQTGTLAALKVDAKQQQDKVSQFALESGDVKADVEKAHQDIVQLQEAIVHSQTAFKEISAELSQVKNAVNEQSELRAESRALSEAYRLTLVSAIESARNRVAALDKALKLKAVEKDQVNSAIDLLRQDLLAQQATLSQALSERNQLRIDLATARAQMADMQKALESSRTSQEHQRSEIISARKDIDNANRNVEMIMAEQKNAGDDRLSFRKEQTETLSKIASIQTELASARKRIDDFSVSLKTAAQSKEDLSAELTAMRNIMEAELATTGNRIDDLSGSLKASEQSQGKVNAQLSDINHAFETQLSVVQKRMDDFNGTIDESKKSQETLQAEFTSIRETLETGMASDKKRFDELKAAVTDSGNEREMLKSEWIVANNTMTVELRTIQQQMGDLRTALTKNEALNEQLNAEMTSIQDTVKVANQPLEELRSGLYKSEKERDSLHKNIARLMQKTGELTQQWNNERISVQDQLKSIDQMYAKLQTADQDLSEKVSSLGNDVKTQQQSILQGEQNRVELKSGISGVQRHLESIATSLETAQDDQRKMDERMRQTEQEAAHKREADTLTEAYRLTLVSKLAGANARVDELNKAFGHEKNSNENLKATITELTRDLEQQREELTSIISERDWMADGLTAANNRINALQADLTQSLKIQKGLKHELEDVRKTLEIQQQLADDIDTLRKQQQSELASIRRQIDTQQKALAEAKSLGGADKKELADLHQELKNQRLTIRNLASSQKAFLAELSETGEKSITPDEVKAELSSKPPDITTRSDIPPVIHDMVFDPHAIDLVVNGWAEAWGGKDVDAYLSCYSQQFETPRNVPFIEWKQQRKVRINRPAYIRIKISNIRKTIGKDGYATVTFDQTYQSDTYSDRVVKILELKWEIDGWKIIKESSRPG